MKFENSSKPLFAPVETIEELLDDLDDKAVDMAIDEREARHLIERIMKLTGELDFLSGPRKEEVEMQHKLMKHIQKLQSHPKLRRLFENMSTE